ncbi:MAG: hypothetical protein K0V04_42585 [Deltaproteobacteria bacterium]|nr:hypothetical protein [Deltaproteobacteria bacterium]
MQHAPPRRPLSWLPWPVFLSLVACGPVREDEASTTGMTGLGGLGSEAGDADQEPSADATGGERLDVGATAGASAAEDGGNAMGCQRVDVVLAIDNSGSMGEEIEALRGPVLDAFPQALLSVNGGIEDFRLGVIDACPKPAFFHDSGADGDCGFSTGENSMSSQSPALAEEFSCVTDFVEDGFSGAPDACIDSGDFDDDDEQAALTAATAVSGEALAINADFLREDALLFVVTVTDEDEALVDVDDIDTIRESLLAAKGGNVDRIAWLGIGGGSSCEGPYGSAKHAQHLEALSQTFIDDGRGMFWDLCEGSLEEAFTTAIEQIVDPACEQFPTQG